MKEIQSAVDAFVASLEVMVRQEALEAVRAALEAPGKPANRATSATPARQPPRPAAPAVSSGGRRSAQEIQAEAERIYIAIRATPGSSAEALKAAAKIPSANFDLPMKLLLEAKRVKKSGEKRATKYFPA